MADTSAKSAASLQDLLVPVLPSMITSIALNAITELSGAAKIAVATGLGVVLWLLVRSRRAGREQARAAELVQKYWRWGLLGLGSVAILALVVTVLVFDRPSSTTVTLAVVGFAVVAGFASAGRPIPGAVAAGIAGGTIGLCLGIAFGAPSF